MRILLIEDHPIVRAACRRMLQDHGELEMLEAGTGAEGLAVCRQASPEVILDLQLPDIKGLDALRELRAQAPGIKVSCSRCTRTRLLSCRRSMPARWPMSPNPTIRRRCSPPSMRSAAARSTLVPMSRRRSRSRACTPSPIRSGRCPPGSGYLCLFREGLSFSEIASRLNISYKTVANVSTRIKEKIGVTTTAALVKAAVEWTQARSAAGSSPGGRLTTPSPSLDS